MHQIKHLRTAEIPLSLFLGLRGFLSVWRKKDRITRIIEVSNQPEEVSNELKEVSNQSL